MKLRLIATALCLTLISSNAFCQFSSGNNLYEYYSSYKRASSKSATMEDLMGSARFMGYISAIADTAHRLPDPWNSCIPWGEKVTVSHVADVVGKFLEDHPEQRHKDGARLVALALREEFPCSSATP